MNTKKQSAADNSPTKASTDGTNIFDPENYKLDDDVLGLDTLKEMHEEDTRLFNAVYDTQTPDPSRRKRRPPGLSDAEADKIEAYIEERVRRILEKPEIKKLLEEYRTATQAAEAAK